MKTTHIAIILDRSGSMGHGAVETAGATNTFVSNMSKVKGSKRFTLVQFDDHYQIDCDQVKAHDVPTLVAFKNYVPRGYTALYDAIGKTIRHLSAHKNVILCVVSDGYENASKEFSHAAIKALIEQKQAEGWEIQFLAADLDPKYAQTMGINVGTISAYDKSDPLMSRRMSDTMSTTVTAYMIRNEDESKTS